MFLFRNVNVGLADAVLVQIEIPLYDNTPSIVNVFPSLDVVLTEMYVPLS